MKKVGFTLLFSISFLQCFSQETNLELTQKQWAEDIDFLVGQVQKTFPAFEQSTVKKAFEEKAELLKGKLGTATSHEVLFGIQKVLHALEDDGCDIVPFQHSLNLKALPLKAFWFEDGLYICDAADAYKELKGQKITKINSMETELVLENFQHFSMQTMSTTKSINFPFMSLPLACFRLAVWEMKPKASTLS